MTITVELAGSKELQDLLRGMSKDIEAEVQKAVVQTALDLQSDVKKSISEGPASGRTYKKYKPKRTHTASAPGQPPMTDTGRLVNSIEFDTLGKLTATVGSKLAYAVWLEYGTKTMNFAGGVGGPRPFFRPAVERIRPKFTKNLEAAIERATR